MNCSSCNKRITPDNIQRLQRRGYNVHEHIDDFYCPQCGEDLYPTDEDWEQMTNEEWYSKQLAAQELSDLWTRIQEEENEQ